MLSHNSFDVNGPDWWIVLLCLVIQRLVFLPAHFPGSWGLVISLVEASLLRAVVLELEVVWESPAALVETQRALHLGFLTQ